MGLLYLWLAPRSPALTWETLGVGAALGLVGVLVRAWAAGHIRKNNQLATAGPYAHTRNPLYFGSFLIGLGFALAAHWVLLLAVGIFWLVVYLPVIQREKAFVSARFPEAYAEWARHVPNFLPRPTPWRDPSAAGREPFDFALYLHHREWQAALGYLAITGWLAARLWMRDGGV